MQGKIREFDAADGLGWIDLDDGTAVRFGLGACSGLAPTRGLRVEVDQVVVRRGVTRALGVRPIFDAIDTEERVWPAPLQEQVLEHRWVDGVQRPVRVRYATFDRDAAHARAPAWAAPGAFIGRAYTPTGVSADPPAPHPFFAPWHAGIVAAGVGALALTPSPDGRAGRFGGRSALLERGWPDCATHGRMAQVLTLEPATMARITGVARRLTVHACVDCLAATGSAWAGTPTSAVSIAWSDGGTIKASPRAPVFEELALAETTMLALPPAWLFKPRRDVRGHVAIPGVAAELFDVKLRRAGETDPAHAYEEAWFAYDAHYAPDDADVVVGGFADAFALCPSCVSPLRQLARIRDYFSEGGLAEVFGGHRTLAVLACDRTPECGGPERGLVVSDL